MISLVDCKGMCDVTQDELEAIEIGGHLSMVEACALACTVEQPEQSERLFKYINNYLQYAERHDTPNRQRSRKALETLNHFVQEHPLA
ncbi:MAG: hypothetical protein R3E95_12140 [Thiolinea sp.]